MPLFGSHPTGCVVQAISPLAVAMPLSTTTTMACGGGACQSTKRVQELHALHELTMQRGHPFEKAQSTRRGIWMDLQRLVPWHEADWSECADWQRTWWDMSTEYSGESIHDFFFFIP